VRPAWALSCGCKSRRKETILIEASRNCRRATDCGKEANSEVASRCTRTPSEAMSSGTNRPKTAKFRWSKLRRRKWGDCAMKDSVLTRGELALCLKGQRDSGASRRAPGECDNRAFRRCLTASSSRPCYKSCSRYSIVASHHTATAFDSARRYRRSATLHPARKKSGKQRCEHGQR
jgi:hypothetical protein